MSLLEILDSMKYLKGGKANNTTNTDSNSLIEAMTQSKAYGIILGEYVYKYSFLGTFGTLALIIILSITLMIWTIVRVVDCPGFSKLIKILLEFH